MYVRTHCSGLHTLMGKAPVVGEALLRLQVAIAFEEAERDDGEQGDLGPEAVARLACITLHTYIIEYSLHVSICIIAY